MVVVDGGIVFLFTILGVEFVAVGALVTYLLYRRQNAPKPSNLEPDGKVATTYGDPNGDTNGRVVIDMEEEKETPTAPTRLSSSSSSPELKKKLIDEYDAPPYEPPTTRVQMDQEAQEDPVMPVYAKISKEAPPITDDPDAKHKPPEKDHEPDSSSSSSESEEVDEEVIVQTTRLNEPRRPPKTSSSSEDSEDEEGKPAELLANEKIPDPVTQTDNEKNRSMSSSSSTSRKDIRPTVLAPLPERKEHSSSSESEKEDETDDRVEPPKPKKRSATPSTPTAELESATLLKDAPKTRSVSSVSSDQEEVILKPSETVHIEHDRSSVSTVEEVVEVVEGSSEPGIDENGAQVKKKKKIIRKRIIRNKEIIELVEEENLIIRKHRKVRNITREESPSSSSSESDDVGKKLITKKKKKKKRKSKIIAVGEEEEDSSSSDSKDENELVLKEKRIKMVSKGQQVSESETSSSSDSEDNEERIVKVKKTKMVSTGQQVSTSESSSSSDSDNTKEVVVKQRRRKMVSTAQQVSAESSSSSSSDAEKKFVSKERRKKMKSQKTQVSASEASSSSGSDVDTKLVQTETRKKMKNKKQQVSFSSTSSSSESSSSISDDYRFKVTKYKKRKVQEQSISSFSTSSGDGTKDVGIGTYDAQRSSRYSSEYHYDVHSPDEKQGMDQLVTTTVIERSTSPQRNVTTHHVYREFVVDGQPRGSRKTTSVSSLSSINERESKMEMAIEPPLKESVAIAVQTDQRKSSSSSSSSVEKEITLVVPPKQEISTREIDVQTNSVSSIVVDINKRMVVDVSTTPPPPEEEKRYKSRETIHFTSGWKRSVTLEDLFQAGIVSETTVKDLEAGKIEEAEVEKTLQLYLVGEEPIAGLLAEDGEKIPIHEAYKRGLIRRGTAVSLLEAQAATGRVIDPRNAEKMSVSEASQKNLIDSQFTVVLNRAERAVIGFKARGGDKTLSLFEAMQNGIVVENHGIRLLEAQIATGGIVDPNANHRLPVEVAFDRGLFDERLNEKLEDSSDDTKGFFDPSTEENLTYLQLMERCIIEEKTGLRLLPFKPKIVEEVQVPVKEVIEQTTAVNVQTEKQDSSSSSSSEDEKQSEKQVSEVQQTEEDSTTTTITMEETIVTTHQHKKKSRHNIHFQSGWKRQVTLDNLFKAGIISEDTIEQLEEGKIDEAEVEKSLNKYLIGAQPIAGLLMSDTGEKVSIYDAWKRNLIRRGTSISLLEAQAATGRIIDPKTAERMSVHEASQKRVIDRQFEAVLTRAERAVYGYKTRLSNETLSLFEAMKRGLVVENHGVRLLEAQIATGGIIDPNANHRLPVEVAFDRGLFDQKMHSILEDPSDDTRGFFDPNTQENLTYLELMERCVIDKDTELRLLPLQVSPRKAALRVSKVVFESATKRQVLLKDLLAADVLDSQTAQKFDEGKMTSKEVKDMVATLKVYVDGALPIAGIISASTGEKMSIVEASRAGLIRKGTAYELLEAQAACGKIMDVQSGKSVSIEAALRTGLLDKEFQDVVVRADRAVSGYKEPFKRDVLSLCEAMSRHLVVEKHAIRLLEAQIATGGIIDMKSPVRISVQVAQKRAMIDARIARKLGRRDTASYYHPMTGENLNYSELMGKCVLDKDSNLLFLMVEGGTVTRNIRPFEPEPESMKIREKSKTKITTEVVEAKQRRKSRKSSSKEETTSPGPSVPSSPPAILSRRVVIVDPSTGDEMTVQEALKQNLIDKDTARELLAQEGDWEENEES